MSIAVCLVVTLVILYSVILSIAGVNGSTSMDGADSGPDPLFQFNLLDYIGTVLGGGGLVYAYFIYKKQSKTDKTVEDLIKEVHSLAHQEHDAADSRKQHYLQSIKVHTALTHQLLRDLKDVLEKYNQDPPAVTWSKVIDQCDTGVNLLAITAKITKRDFDTINPNIRDRHLVDNYQQENIDLVKSIYDGLLIFRKGEYLEQMEDIDVTIANIESTLSSISNTLARIDKEMPYKEPSDSKSDNSS